MTRPRLVDVVALERDLNLAIDDLDEHEKRCAVHGPFCEECRRLSDAVDEAESKLAGIRPAASPTLDDVGGDAA